MSKIWTFIFLTISFIYFTTAFDNSCSTNDTLKNIIIRKCKIDISDSKLQKQLEHYTASRDTKLLELYLRFPADTMSAVTAQTEKSLRKTVNGNTYFYTPFDWFITTSRLGQKLINLKPNYETLSLNTLSLKTEVLYIRMRDEPAGCLKSIPLRQYLFLVKEFLQKYLKNPTDSTILNNKVCTSIMKAVNGYAWFSSICYDGKRNTTCIYLETDRWSITLQAFIQFIKVLAILFCPLLIPKKLYQLKSVENSCTLKIRQNVLFKVRLSEDRYVVKNSEWAISIPLSHFQEWKKFKPTKLLTGVDYVMNLTELDLGIDGDTLVSSSYIPTGVVNVLLSNLYYCKLREVSGFNSCCSSSVCPNRVQSKCCLSSSSISWFRCCRIFMKLLVFLLLPVPWILRLLIYNRYEKGEFIIRQSVANARGVRLPFEGYLLGYVSPVHWVFLFMYIIYGVDLLAFGTFAHSVMRRIRIMVKQCILDMHFALTFKVVNWSVNLFLLPFTVFGIVGCILAPFYWIFIIPVIFIAMCYFYIPLVNLLIRFLLHIIWFCIPDCILHSKGLAYIEHISRKMEKRLHVINLQSLYHDHFIVNRENRSSSYCYRLFQMFMALLCLFTMVAIAILLTECVGYVIEVIAFTLIGSILHSDLVLPVLSLAFLMLIYLVRSINKVRLKYMDFNNMIVNEIIKSVGEYDSKTSANTAHFSPNGRLDGFAFSNTNGLLCRLFSLLLVLDANEMPLIPSEFFYKACEMDIPNLPGSLSKNFFKSFLRLFVILLFLVFVTLVVMTFGEMYNVSTINQMLATLAGGVFPWFLEKMVNLQAESKEINTKSLNFKTTFQKTIDEFAQTWKILDIVGDLKPLNESKEEDYNEEENAENVTIHILDCDEIEYIQQQRDQNLNVHISKPIVRETPHSNSDNSNENSNQNNEFTHTNTTII